MFFETCCSSADEECDDPGTKAVRERERRQANNVRERLVNTRSMHFVAFFVKKIRPFRSFPQAVTGILFDDALSVMHFFLL